MLYTLHSNASTVVSDDHADVTPVTEFAGFTDLIFFFEMTRVYNVKIVRNFGHVKVETQMRNQMRHAKCDQMRQV
jgi:hypothetical protein